MCTEVRKAISNNNEVYINWIECPRSLHYEETSWMRKASESLHSAVSNADDALTKKWHRPRPAGVSAVKIFIESVSISACLRVTKLKKNPGSIQLICKLFYSIILSLNPFAHVAIQDFIVLLYIMLFAFSWFSFSTFIQLVGSFDL